MSAQASAGPRRLLVVATSNAGKRREIAQLLAGLPFEVVSQDALGIDAPEETGASFTANALLKARHAAALSGAAALADDSGLEVDALGGAPGIYSARYAGVGASAADNNAKLVEALAAVSGRARSARFRCSLVYVSGPDDAHPLVAHGVWEGEIATTPCGTDGFGYDPYFWIPALGRSAAQLGVAEKNAQSHRGAALRELLAQLRARV